MKLELLYIQPSQMDSSLFLLLSPTISYQLMDRFRNQSIHQFDEILIMQMNAE